MLTSLKRWLAPPVFEGDEQKTRIAELLNAALLTMLAGALLYSFLAPIDLTLIPRRIALVGAIIAVIVAMRFVMTWGHVRLAGAVTLGALWIISTLATAISGGVQSPALAAYLVISLAAGLIFNFAVGIGIALLSLAAGFMILLADTSGELSAFTAAPAPAAVLWGYAAYMFLGAVLVGLAIRRVDLALADARRELAERRQAEQALQAAEARYRDLVERIPAVVYRSEPGANGSWHYVSPQIKSLSGFTPQEWLADSGLWYRQIHTQDREAVIRTEAEALAARREPQLEYRLIRRDGQEVWVRDESVWDVEPDSGRVLVQGFLLDITQRKQAELTAQRQMQELTTLQAVAAQIATATTEDELVEKVTGIIGATLYSTNFGILLMDQTRNQLRLHPSYHSDLPVEAEYVPDGRGVVAIVGVNGQPLRVPDVRRESSYYQHTPTTLSEIAVPIKVGEKVLGVINAESDQIDAFSDEDERLLLTIADQLAAALERLRAENAQGQYSARMEILHEIDRALLGAQSRQAIAQIPAREVQRLVNCQRASVSIFNWETSQAHFLAVSSITGAYLPVDSVISLEAFGDHIVSVLKEGRHNIIGDVLASEPVAETDRQHAREGIRAWLNMPLTYQDELIGALNMGSIQPNFFTAIEIDIAREVANQLAIALKQAELKADMAEALAREQRLRSVAQTINSVLDLRTVLVHVVRLAAELTGAGAGSLSLADSTGEALTDIYSFNLPDGLSHQTMGRGEGLTWQVFENEPSILRNDYVVDPHALPEWVAGGLRSYLGVRVSAGETRLGVLGLYQMESIQPFNQRDVALAEAVAQQAGIAIQNARLYTALQQELAERQRAEQTVVESEKTLRALLDAATDAQFLIDTQGTYLAWNEALVRSLSKNMEDLRGHNTYTLLPPALAETRREQLQQVIASGKAIRFEDQGPYHWYENSIAPVFDAGGQVVKLAIFARDITERKRSEAALHRRDAILEAVAFAAQQFLKATTWQTSIESVLAELGRATDASHVYIFENHRTAEGIEVASQRFEWVAPRARPDIDNPTFQNVPIWESAFWHWAEALSAGEAFQANLSALTPTETAYLLPRGVKSILDVPIFVNNIWWGIIGLDDHANERDWSAAEVDALKAAAGTLSAAIQRQRADEEIHQLNATLEKRVVERTAALEAINQELEAFSYSVSHDLRAPLRSIDGFSQALLEDYENKLDSDGQRYLKIVRRETQRMGILIDDLLSLSRVGRRDLRRVQVDLSKLAQELIDEFRQREPERQVEVTIVPNMHVTGDANLLRIMLDNLLANAWKFSSKRELARIEFGLRQAEPELEFFVRDNGAGFDMNYASKLFGVFQRLHTSQEFEGTGVGLATVKRILLRHGGRVWAEGAPDLGATFYFTVPEETV